MFLAGKYSIFLLRYKISCVKGSMPEMIVFGFVAPIGSKFLCVCFHSFSTGKSLGLCFPFAKRKNQNICFHLQTGNSFVIHVPSLKGRNNNASLDFPKESKAPAKRKQSLFFSIDCIRQAFNKVPKNYIVSRALYII